jgi:hypothetical protein
MRCDKGAPSYLSRRRFLAKAKLKFCFLVHAPHARGKGASQILEAREVAQAFELRINKFKHILFMDDETQICQAYVKST